MSGIWNDFNSAQSNSNVIPKGTLAKVRLTIRPGGFDDPSQGWTGGFAKRAATGAVFRALTSTGCAYPKKGVALFAGHSLTNPTACWS